MFAEELEKFNLLKHDFYQSWEMGKLTKNDLKEYVCQYFQHVNDFPRYLSAIHTGCSDIMIRQIILQNLIDEESGAENHPELWLRFSEAVDVDRETVKNAKLSTNTEALRRNFFLSANGSLAEGLGALYAYERQVPEVAKTKINSLKKFYNISDDEALKFFTVHIGADEWHSQECEDLIKLLTTKEQQRAKDSALKLAESLWKFLDGMEEMRTSKNYLNF